MSAVVVVTGGRLVVWNHGRNVNDYIKQTSEG